MSSIPRLLIRHLWAPCERQDFYDNHSFKVDPNASIVLDSVWPASVLPMWLLPFLQSVRVGGFTENEAPQLEFLIGCKDAAFYTKNMPYSYHKIPPSFCYIPSFFHPPFISLSLWSRTFERQKVNMNTNNNFQWSLTPRFCKRCIQLFVLWWSIINNYRIPALWQRELTVWVQQSKRLLPSLTWCWTFLCSQIMKQNPQEASVLLVALLGIILKNYEESCLNVFFYMVK